MHESHPRKRTSKAGLMLATAGVGAAVVCSIWGGEVALHHAQNAWAKAVAKSSRSDQSDWTVNDAFYVASGHQTATERYLSEVSDMTFGNNVQIRCTDLTPAGAKPNSDAAITKGLTNTQPVDGVYFIRLAPDICQEAMLVRNRTVPFGTYTGELVAMAVETVAHENEHTLHHSGRVSEGLIDCYGVQKTNILAMNMEASIDIANQLGQAAAETQPHWRPLAYQVPSGCYQGGPDDLHPTYKSFFPIPRTQ